MILKTVLLKAVFFALDGFLFYKFENDTILNYDTTTYN